MQVEKIGDATLYLGDCLEVLPQIGAVDTVITDPPYGIGFKYESHKDDPGLYLEWRDKWFSMLRQTAPRIAVSPGLKHTFSWPQPDWVLCWHKPACMTRCTVGFSNWEPVLLYGKPPKTIVDVFTAPIVVDRSLDGHPCPKPEAWGAHLVDRLTKPGDIVLDPFMGSGTVGVACVKQGRRFVGIEIEPKYFDLSCRRIEEAARQPSLFPKATPEQESLL